MLRVAVLDDYQKIALKVADWSRLGDDVEVVTFDRHMFTVEEASKALQDFDIVCGLRERMPFSRALIESLPRLKFLVFSGTRSRTVDLEAAAERGIPVSNAPSSRHTLEANPNGPGYPAIVELCWAFILAAARNLPEENRNIRSGEWKSNIPIVLSGKTLGMVGFGRIGSTMGKLARAFDMNLIAWSENLTPERAAAGGATCVTKDELFSQSDVISIHLRLSERSIDTVGEREFRLMKPSAILINTARGPIVNEQAMIDALRERRIRAVGMDVFHTEPMPADHPLQKLDNAIMTPHIGYATDRNYPKVYNEMIEAILAWREGSPINIFKGDDGTRQ